LSQYPHEKQVLFPPLSGIRVEQTHMEDNIIVDIHLSMDPTNDTVEQVGCTRAAHAK
jgi:hypothetical protein